MNYPALEKLYTFWFSNSNNWFNQSDVFDNLVTQLFSELLNSASLDIEITTPSIFTSIIILYDQIPRHIYRGNEEKINHYLNIIIPFVKKNYYFFNNNLTSEEFSFVLLPLRHTNNFTMIKFVIDETWQKIFTSVDEKSLLSYKRFLNATYNRYINKNSDDSNLILHDYLVSKSEFNYDRLFGRQYLDLLCIRNTKVVDIDIDSSNILYLQIKQFVDDNKITHGIISLSGGVDSMVLSYILNKLKIDLIAVHINYNNRPNECLHEEKIIINWCKYILKIPLFVRTIEEINRSDSMKYEMRDLYESYTKNIRFNAYKNAHQRYFKGENIAVFMGHNRDDCFENILTNIASQTHIDNLTGMLPTTNLSNINFIRPMLECDKKTIYEFAKLYQIPFFVDSTPKWSQRGMIRDNIRPALEKWNDKMIDSMFELSTTLTLYQQFVKSIVKKDLLQKTLIYPVSAIQLNPIYWKEVFNQSNIYLSNKSLENYINKLEYIKKNHHQINHLYKHILNKQTLIHWLINKENNLLIDIVRTNI